MRKNNFYGMLVLCAVIMLGLANKAYAQNCIDMTALGQKNVIGCLDEDLVDVQVTPQLDINTWATTVSTPSHPRQKLMTSAGTDALCSSLSVLPPSGEPSILLATDGYSATDMPKGSMAIFQLTVDKDHPIVILNFAGVMEKTQHTDYSKYVPYYNEYIQPSMFFQITVGKEDSLIKETPMTFTPNEAKTWTSFTDNNGRAAVWRNWTPVAYDLSKFIGRKVNIYARVRDCAIEGMYVDGGGNVRGFKTCESHHASRAYVNIACSPAITLESQDCEKGESKLSMPEGFVSYKWYYQHEPNITLGTNRTITLSTQHKSDTLCCEVVHYVVNTPIVKKFYLNNCEHNVCANQGTIEYVVPSNLGDVANYSIHFDNAAQAQGFTDINQATPSSANVLSVTMPEHYNSYVRPDDYSAEIILFMANQTVDTLHWDFSVLYPSYIIGQDWNDVLYIKNSEYNGGYEFTNIAWFRNDEAVDGSGAHNAYMVNPSLFNGQDLYVAELTCQDDGKTIRTCPCQPKKDQLNEIIFDIQVTQKAPGRIHISSQTISGNYTMYDVRGNLLGKGEFGPKENAEEIDIEANVPSGVYILKFVGENGKSQSKKLFVE